MKTDSAVFEVNHDVDRAMIQRLYVRKDALVQLKEPTYVATIAINCSASMGAIPSSSCLKTPTVSFRAAAFRRK